MIDSYAGYLKELYRGSIIAVVGVFPVGLVLQNGRQLAPDGYKILRTVGATSST